MKTARKGAESTGGRAVTSRRAWWFSLAVSAAIIGASIVLSATVNPLFGRAVHWDWMAGLAPTLFVLFVLALRRRWI